MTIDVKDAAGATQTIQSLDDLAKGAGAASAATLRTVTASDDAVLTALALLSTAAQIGEVQASPTANTVLARLKTIADAVAAATPAGTNLIGKVGIDQTTPGTTNLVAAGLTAGANEVGRTNIRHVMAQATALTRPANTTAYTANDSISDNATAGSVTANVVTVSDTNDDPVNLTQVLLTSTDTAPGTAGTFIRLHLFNSDPTASSGVVGGDNAAWSNKQAGWVGSFTGQMVAFSDGSRGVLVPDGPPVLTVSPATGARTFWWQIQTLGAFTPSANSTTFTPTFRGYQGRAA